MSLKGKQVISRDRLIEQPYELFAECRKINPVLNVELFDEDCWLVTGYAEAEALLKDSRFVRESGKPGGGRPPHSAPAANKMESVLAMKHLMFVFRDAPFHTRIRGLISHAFTPPMMNRLSPTIEQIAADLLQGMKGKREHDLLTDFAHRLPIQVIASIVGVPREDSERVRTWSEAFQTFIDYGSDSVGIDSNVDLLTEAADYFRQLVALRRKEPQQDLISRLIAAEREEGSLNEDEIVATCFLLFFAGHETTINAITNGYYLLLKHPDAYARLQRNPALLPGAVEEMLRYEPPAMITQRRASVDMEFFGQSIRRGQTMIVAMGGANRDPRANADPDRFDIERTSVKHLSFGIGPHFCLGAPLSRIEIPIAIGGLLNHVKQPRLLEEPVWRIHAALRGMRSLRVEAEID